jgi:hypothetical protein
MKLLAPQLLPHEHPNALLFIGIYRSDKHLAFTVLDYHLSAQPGNRARLLLQFRGGATRTATAPMRR